MAHIDALLGRGEQIVHSTRQHSIMLISRLLVGLMLIVLLIVTGVVSQQAFNTNALFNVAGMSLELSGQLILFAMFVISVLVLLSSLVAFLRWSAEKCIITDRRLLHIRGILGNQVFDMPLDKISDISLKQSWLGRLFNYGKIEFLTAAEETTVRIDGVRSPRRLQQATMDAKQNYDHGYGYLDTRPLPEQPAQPLPVEFEVHRALEDLARLRDRGILSTEEFEKKKRELLTRI